METRILLQDTFTATERHTGRELIAKTLKALAALSTTVAITLALLPTPDAVAVRLALAAVSAGAPA